MERKPFSPVAVGFDFTSAMGRLCRDITERLPELQHIDMDRVALRYCQVRRGGRYGVQATLTPLRFAGGSTEVVRRGRRWTIDRIHDGDGREMLYLLSFYLPRFLDQPWDEKLATVCHELWHIGEAFDGDLRRHEGRCYAHGSSERKYHAAMKVLAEKWLALGPPPELYEELRCSFGELRSRHGAVLGARIASPKLRRIDD
jgi:predicted metallopeptidase